MFNECYRVQHWNNFSFIFLKIHFYSTETRLGLLNSRHRRMGRDDDRFRNIQIGWEIVYLSDEDADVAIVNAVRMRV